MKLDAKKALADGFANLAYKRAVDMTTLRDVLIRMIDSDPAAIKRLKSFENPKVTWLGLDAQRSIRRVAPDAKYIIKASAGMGGHAADIPWIGIRTEAATGKSKFRGGLYVAYLFPKDRSGVYLSLQQGITDVLGSQKTSSDYHARRGSERELLQRRQWLKKILTIPDHLALNDITLRSTTTRGQQYEFGHVCGIRYDRADLPNEPQLADDLALALKVYDDYDPAFQYAANLANGNGTIAIIVKRALDCPMRGG